MIKMKSKLFIIKSLLACISLILLFTFETLIASPHDYFKIKVIDEETGRGIPLVELRTQNWIRYYTDSNGIVAFYEPGLMDQDLFLAEK